MGSGSSVTPEHTHDGQHDVDVREVVVEGVQDEQACPDCGVLSGKVRLLGAGAPSSRRSLAPVVARRLHRATMTLTHDRLHAGDCTACATSTGMLDRIVRKIHLDGDLDDDQRAKLLDITDRCPVHRTQHPEMVIETDPV